MNRWFKRCAILAMATTCVMVVHSPAQQANDNSPLAIKAQSDMDNGNYSAAVQEFETVAQQNSDKADYVAQIQEKIRVCQTNLAKPATQPGAAAPAGGDVPMTATTRIPHPTPKDGEVMDMAIKELGNFDYDADRGGNIPADVKALSGHEIKLHGFMIPMDQAANITQFALVPSLFACCFGQPPQLQHTIVVNCPKGKAINYFPDEISVDGTLSVEEKKDDGFIVSIFQVQAQSVKPLAK